MSKSISIQPYYRYAERFWKVQAGPFMPVYSLHLRRIIEQIYIMNQTYSRTFVLFFDLHMPTNPDTNDLVTNFLRKLRTQLSSVYKIKKFGFIWCREKESADNPHYHFMIMMDGSVIRHPKKLMILIQTLWEKISNGYARASKNGYYMMRRDDEEIIAEVIYRASYQAKTRSKSCRPIQTKTYATSRLKP